MAIYDKLNVALVVIIVLCALYVYIVKKRRKKAGREAGTESDFVRQRKAPGSTREPVDGDSLIDEFYSEKTSPGRKAEIVDELESLGYDTRSYRRHERDAAARRDDRLMGGEGDGYRGTEPWDMEDE